MTQFIGRMGMVRAIESGTNGHPNRHRAALVEDRRRYVEWLEANGNLAIEELS